jgi:hypothetical protein
MANTPFELYEEAYRLHYREKKIPDAVKIYEAIMREFPDSSECGYAFIQLQKIKANAVTAGLRSNGGNSLAVVACAVSCAAVLIAVTGLLFAFHELRAEHHRTTYAVATLSELQAGKIPAARKILDAMIKQYPDDILARELSLSVGSGEQLSGRISGDGPPAGDSSVKSPASDHSGAPGDTLQKKNQGSRAAKSASRVKAARPEPHADSSPLAPPDSSAR